MRRGMIPDMLFWVAGVALIGSLAACGPTYPDCEDDGHCKDHGEYCVDKLCRKCRDDTHCNATNKCKVCDQATYTCEHKAGCCTSDADCPGGRCWAQAGQATGTCGPICREDKDCPADQMCKNGQCVAKACSAANPCPPGKVCQDGICVEVKCELEVIYFDFNESYIRSDARTTLERNVDCLKKRTAENVKIDGHCDERGTIEYNLALGRRRAESAKKFLSTNGIPSSKLNAHSYGKERPTCTERNEDCWQRNRRAEFIFQ